MKTGAGARSAALEIPGAKIVYAEHGRGRPVVCLHGNTGSRRWFQGIMDVAGCRVVAPDLPNFGESSPLLGEPTIERYAEAGADFIRGMGLQGAVLLGHSLGGAVAMSLAVRWPALVSGLVLVDSAPPSGFPTPEERDPLIEKMRVDREFLAASLKAIAPSLEDSELFSRLVDDATRMAKPAWIGNARALGAFHCTDACRGFSRPVLVIWGRQDVLVSEAMAQETVSAFPRARLLVMENVGHSPPVEDPEGLVRALRSFVADLEMEAAGRGKEPA